MFSALDQQEKQIVVDAMAEKVTKAGDVVIKEGDKNGDSLYVVGTGTLDCTKVFGNNTEPTFLKTY